MLPGNMPRVCVMRVDGSVILDHEMEPLDVIQSVRVMCENASGNLGCYLTAQGQILDDSTTIEDVVGVYGDHLTAVIDANNASARYKASTLALQSLTPADWESLSALPLDELDFPPAPLEACAEIICRILGITAACVRDKEEIEEEKERNDYWGTAKAQIFNTPTCLLAVCQPGALKLSRDVVERVHRYEVVFEFTEKSIRQQAQASGEDGIDECEENDEDLLEDEPAQDEASGVEGEDDMAQREEDLDSIFSKYPRAARCLYDWACAVKGLADKEPLFENDVV
eukprot:TRINITY_DN106822_c0_g1_i1.p1 TRINITY_DN106822_c0_g1~~TRINITY_DN106822_c0_g1_i1.p1  ORF type:complete len:284 (-),score=56.06 TRINITY_DN106822_c0_g1_i1:272-1123(-)